MDQSDQSKPALTDRRGLGGIIAQEGFDYQLWDGLARVPAWLANPVFESLIFEGLEDLEARFFAPQAPRGYLLERYQAKGGVLGPAQIRGVFESFQEFEEAYPDVVRRHVLVTPHLPSTLDWLGRDPDRVRKARPFYAPFADIVRASEEALRARLVREFGDILGSFVSCAVDVEQRNLPNRDAALAQFGTALQRVFPGARADFAAIERAFDALSTVARKHVGEPLGRALLVDVIEQTLGQALDLPKVFPVHVRSDRSGIDDGALEIDASAFSGGDHGWPTSGGWQRQLLAPLAATSRWLRTANVHRIRLTGSYRLSTGFVIGWSLRSAAGFDLEIPTRDGGWSTDDRGMIDSAATWQSTETQGMGAVGGHLAVSIGILRDPSHDVRSFNDGAETAMLALYLPSPITSGAAAQAGVASVKRAVDAVITRLRPTIVDVYLATPAAFAVALGHRWNAMPSTRLHEFDASVRQYIPTISIP